jgi:nitrogen regulatory protein P-II 1
MVKIEAIIHPVKLDDVRAVLKALGVERISICHVSVPGAKAVYRGAEYEVDVPRVKLELLVSSLVADEVVDALSQAARTGTLPDDGTILISEISDAISVSSGQRVRFALS